MHIYLAIVYGIALWSAILTYTAAVDGPTLAVALLAPLIISASVCVLLAIDLVLHAASRAFTRHNNHTNSTVLNLTAKD